MARPARFNAEYFSHDADFRNDRRIKAIRARFGLSGYALILMLMEVLTDADYTQLDTSEMELELLSGDLGVSVTEIGSLIQFATKIGFFTQNDTGILKCPDLDRALEPVFVKRNRAKIAANKGNNIVSVTEIGISVTEIPQSKVKESKGEESKVIISDNVGDKSPVDPPKNELTKKEKSFLELFNKTCKREFKNLPEKAKKQFEKLLKKGYKYPEVERSLTAGYSDSLGWPNPSNYTPEYATREAEFEKYLYSNVSPGKAAEQKQSMQERIAKQNARV